MNYVVAAVQSQYVGMLGVDWVGTDLWFWAGDVSSFLHTECTHHKGRSMGRSPSQAVTSTVCDVHTIMTDITEHMQ